jgi:exonuclease III
VLNADYPVRKSSVHLALARSRRRPAVHHGLLPERQGLGHDDFPKKLAWFDSLLRYWATQDRNAPAVLCGDFNVVPATLDTWLTGDTDDLIFHTKDERDRFGALLDLGLTDLFRHRHPDKKAFSWWDTAVARSMQPGFANRSCWPPRLSRSQ